MAFIYQVNSRGGTRSFDFDITYFYPIIVTPYQYLVSENSAHSSLKGSPGEKRVEKPKDMIFVWYFNFQSIGPLGRCFL
jgi:hypothetical protein